MTNKITQLFNIQYPIIQAGMIWNSGWKLASASSNSGILGLIGAGSMYPNVLRDHIQKCKKATNKPFGVNVPMLYPNIEEIMNIIVDENVKIVLYYANNITILDANEGAYIVSKETLNPMNFWSSVLRPSILALCLFVGFLFSKPFKISSDPL